LAHLFFYGSVELVNDQYFLGNGHGQCTDYESGQLYWISGIKRNGQDRHWAGKGKIQIEKNIVNEYLLISGLEKLDLNKYELITSKPTNKQRFTSLLNETID
jgi:hypothetical protein